MSRVRTVFAKYELVNVFSNHNKCLCFCLTILTARYLGVSDYGLFIFTATSFATILVFVLI